MLTSVSQDSTSTREDLLLGFKRFVLKIFIFFTGSYKFDACTSVIIYLWAKLPNVSIFLSHNLIFLIIKTNFRKDEGRMMWND